jgi:hypothetical protein
MNLRNWSIMVHMWVFPVWSTELSELTPSWGIAYCGNSRIWLRGSIHRVHAQARLYQGRQNSICCFSVRRWTYIRVKVGADITFSHLHTECTRTDYTHTYLHTECTRTYTDYKQTYLRLLTKTILHKHIPTHRPTHRVHMHIHRLNTNIPTYTD